VVRHDPLFAFQRAALRQDGAVHSDVTTPLPLVETATVERLRDALTAADYTVGGCVDALGPLAYAALARGETVPALRATAGGSPVETLVRLFLLQEPVPREHAERALPLAALQDALLVEPIGADHVRALIDVRPYGEGDVDWWIASDLGAGLMTSSTRGRRLDPDYVLGVGGASTTLAQLTVRQPVRRALDLGTGCGVQALHLSRHAQHVTGTDRNERALRLAELTIALSLPGTPGSRFDLLAGDLFEPVSGERYDLIVSNPPFVVSPDSAYDGGRYAYRDSGLPGDELCRRLVAGAPAHLNDGGWCQLLANWLHVEGVDWRERVAAWVAPTGCDAWVVQREAQDPAEYAELWLRDGGEAADPDVYQQRYAAWLDYFDTNRVEAIGFGWITLHAAGSDAPYLRLAELGGQIEQPIGAYLPDWFARHDFLRATDDRALLASRLRVPDGVRLEQIAKPGASGWQPDAQRLRQQDELRQRSARRCWPAARAPSRRRWAPYSTRSRRPSSCPPSCCATAPLRLSGA
jgi:hypothetical protein